MDAFAYRSGALHAEGVPVERLAAKYGTPLYVYSRNHFREQYRALASAMADVRPLICFSVKANSCGAVIRTFMEEGAGLDIVSGGELFRVLRVGASASKIVFAGVGKTEPEIEYALRRGILFFTVESEPEAECIAACARRLGRKARIAFRVNPDVDPKTHKYIITGKRENKFGLDLARAEAAYEAAAKMPGLEIVGLHMHIGSQILSTDPYVKALERILPLCRRCRRRHAGFRYLDIGGGMGIRYRPDQEALSPDRFAAAVVPLLRRTGLSVVLEPGRSLVGNGGILVCRVQYVKESHRRKFVVVDAAMNDLIRPALYEAHHEVLPVNETACVIRGDLVGPVCESGDFIAQDRDLPAVRTGDLLAVCSTGAYGFSMSSNYNSRPRAAELLVDGSKVLLARRRESWEDLVKGERIA